MSSSDKNLSDFSTGFPVPNAKDMIFGIVVSEWNFPITGALLEGCKKTLLDHGANPDNILVTYVPGSFELPLGAKWALEKNKLDAVICLGCVIQGETRHFDFICEAVAQGIMNLNLEWGKPVVFGVLTPENMQQAIDRAGGKHGNKGDEAAVTAIKMSRLRL
jgi:6,7-dimethyl-8-ribityllumazine synthase